MLNIKIAAVGNLKEDYLRAACAEYETRLGGMCRTAVIEVKEQRLPKNPSPAQISGALEKEAEALRALIAGRSYKICLCVEGEQLCTEELADKISALTLSYSEICFVIGGPEGIAPSLKGECDMRLSLSRLTFTHRLARVVLLEALYRAFSVINGKKYHRT